MLNARMNAMWLGRVEYGAAWELQKELVELRRAARIPDTLLLLEHPRTLTMGRRYREEHLLAPRETLLARGFSLFDVDRGGDVTYHGPGQLVGYPILDLNAHGRDLHAHMRKLEEVLISALAPFGILGIRNPPHTGVWVENRKIAAIGIKVSRYVTSHGFALNTSTDLSDFDTIIPCGIRNSPVTSASAETGRRIEPVEIIPAVLGAFYAVFGFALPENSVAESELRTLREAAAGAESQKILVRAIDARKIDVIDYAPLSGRSDFPGIRRQEI